MNIFRHFFSSQQESNFTEWSLISAGYNGHGQLGRGGDEKIPKPVENLPKKNLFCISTGSYHSVALYKDGSVFGWGNNEGGCLGFQKEVVEVKFPLKINSLPKIIDVKCGSAFTLFLTIKKKVIISSEFNKNDIFEEITICEPAVALFGFCDPWIVGESGVIYWYDYKKTKQIEKFGPFSFGIPKQIVSIYRSVLLLTTSGQTYGMSLKKLRPNSFDENSKVVCDNEEYFSPINSLRDVKIRKITGSMSHFLALSEDNKVFAWGWNDYGQLGVGDEEHRYNGFCISTASGDAKIVDIVDMIRSGNGTHPKNEKFHVSPIVRREIPLKIFD
ncbi:hypothetical protein TRFO_43075 [Tritrichomonas foetus]|uniref:Uncharacterized protein n=1 Tax=Tritrichomonas foetus TaxID=1144522 RepID=A0A1J4KSX4_9EUKA|nr:hypothetical protein TRFO_43075 [Tritrichomonas foetus]|eukprot:OHT14393.1 hypothetical protein TRFO_43075 [Tritrichomonas foetus]